MGRSDRGNELLETGPDRGAHRRPGTGDPARPVPGRAKPEPVFGAAAGNRTARRTAGVRRPSLARAHFRDAGRVVRTVREGSKLGPGMEGG